MGPIKIDFSKISGTSKDIKPLLPLKADFGVMFYERDTRDMYVYDNFEWTLWGRDWKNVSTIEYWTQLKDTPSIIEPGKVPMGNAAGDAIEWVLLPTTFPTSLSYTPDTGLLTSVYTDGSLRQVNITRPFIRGTWVELEALRSAGELKIGERYLLTDYQCKYYIDNSMTDDIKERNEVNETFSGYAYFYVPMNSNVRVGDVVTITSLPSWYTGPTTVGSQAAITEIWDFNYMKFNTDLEIIVGATFSYEIPRYLVNTVYNNTTVNDSYGNPVLTPSGLVNTEVHNGQPYMQMTGEENAPPPIEELILTAIEVNQFSTTGESLTFPGDVVEYEFNNNEVLNDNAELLDTRNGLVTKRVNEKLAISINKDWRGQKYRRYKITDETKWVNYILQNNNNDLYKIGGNNAFSTSADLTQEHRYVLPSIEGVGFYYDFTSNGTTPNPFLAGQDTAPDIYAGRRYSIYEMTTYHMDSTCDDPTYARDLNILPLDVNYNPHERVSYFKVDHCTNTTSRLLETSLGIPGLMEVDIYTLKNSTFCTNFKLKGSGYTDKITCLDDITIINNGSMSDANFYSSGELNNSGSLWYFTSGAMKHSAYSNTLGSSWTSTYVDSSCKLHNTTIGGKRSDVIRFNNVISNKFMEGGIRTQYSSFTNCIYYLTGIKFGDQFYSNTITMNTGVYKNEKKNLYGYYYGDTAGTQGRAIVDNNLGDMLYQRLDGNNNNQIDWTTIAESQ